MNYSIKIIRWSRALSNGQYPIQIRVTLNGDRKYIPTQYSATKDQWNEEAECLLKSHPNARIANVDLGNKKQQLMKMLLDAEIDNRKLSIEQLKKNLIRREDKNANQFSNIFIFVDRMIEDTQHRVSEGTIRNYQLYIKKLKEFYQGSELSFEEMDSNFLLRFEKYLVKQGHRPGYINSIFRGIRKFFNFARENGVTKNYPFNNFEVMNTDHADKEFLSDEELDKVEEFADTTDNAFLKETAIWFLYGCYTGLRVSDWFLYSDDKIQSCRLMLRAKKNGEWVVMPIVGRLKEQISRIKITPLSISSQCTINNRLKLIAAKLQIKKNLSTHCARKTFAVTMCAEKGISLATCAELMGITQKVCEESYYRVTNRKIDSEILSAWETKAPKPKLKIA